MLGRGHQLTATLEYLREVLVAGDYQSGTRYYHSPDTFLYFTARLVRRFPAVHKPLIKAVRERQGATEFALRALHALDVGALAILDDSRHQRLSA